LAFSSAFSLLIIERPDCMIEERGLKQRGVKKRNFTAFKIIPNVRLSNLKGHANDFTACLAVLANQFRYTLFFKKRGFKKVFKAPRKMKGAPGLFFP